MERDIIAWLRTNFPARPPLAVGIGDDAAVLQPQTGSTVITTDAIVDGVHFESARQSCRRIGHKSAAVNFSDLAAMGAVPTALVVALVLPQNTTLPHVQQLYAGIDEVCSRWNAVLAGGDTNFGPGPLVICGTAVGRIPPDQSPWLCSGAKPGDEIFVSGSFGGSILGKHLDFDPRCDLVKDLAGKFEINAATDVSDGLAFNLGVILEASGCGAVIDLSSIPISAAAKQAEGNQTNGKSALDHALYDGEDFELILVTRPTEGARIRRDPIVSSKLTRIGSVVTGSGIRATAADGSVQSLPIRGFSHGGD